MGPACAEVALEYINQCESLREKMRLEFRLTEAQREVDLQASRLEEEKARAAQEIKLFQEQMQTISEENTRQKKFFQEEQAQLASRLTSMKKEAKKREKSHDARIKELMEQQEIAKAELEASMKEDFSKTIEDERVRADEQMNKIASQLDQKEKEMKRIRDDHLKQMDVIREKLNSTTHEQPEVHHHYHQDGCTLS